MKKKIVFVPLLVTLFTLAACNQAKGESHKVNLLATHGTWQADKFAYANLDYTATFVPEEGFMLDEESITVKFNQTRVFGCYTFNSNVLTISKEYLAVAVGDIEIKASPYLIPYEANIRVSNANPAHDTPRYHKQFDVIFTPIPGYRLPNGLKVLVNDELLSPGVGYEYVIEENRLSIYPDYVVGNILITGDSVLLSKLTFDGDKGVWDKTEHTKTVLIDGGTLFSEVAPLAGTPKVLDNSQTFDHWTFEDGSEIPENYKVQDGDKFKAAYVASKFMVHVSDNYFPDDHYSELVEYHKGVIIPFEIAEEDRNSRCLPDTVEVTCVDPEGSTVSLDFAYIRDTSFKGRIEIYDDQIVSDVQIRMSTPLLVNITFSVGEGTWDVEETKTDDVTVTLANNKSYTLLEAWRFAQIDLGNITNDPIANDGDKVFVGWIKDGEDKPANVNGEVTATAHYTASYSKRTFENDTWENVMQAANAGLDFLYETYNTDESKIVASTRNIIVGNPTLGYSQQKVRLIGVGQDVVVSSGNADPITAALTFEFTNTFYEMNFGNDRVYRDSSIRAALNKDLITSIPDFNNLEGKMSTIRTVEKETNIPGTGVVTTEDKCFLLSANEMALNSPDMPGQAEVIGGEGPVYQYYATHTSPEYRQKGHSPFIENENYWLRSEEHTLSIGAQNVYAINEDGKVYTLSTLDTIGVAPAFAIGLSTHSHHEGTISTTNCTCTSHGSNFMVVDDEMGFVRDIVLKANEGYIFNDVNDVKVAVDSTASGEKVEITDASLSDDHKILKCSISYNALAASNDRTITLTANTTSQGYAGSINLNSCTSASGKTGFPIIQGKGATIIDTYTASQGHIFSGNIDNDISCATSGVTVTNHEYLDDHSTLTATITYTDAAAAGDIALIISASMEGYVGTIDFDDEKVSTEDRTSFPIERGRESMPRDNLTFTLTAKNGYYFNESDPTLSLSYTSDVIGGKVEFSDVNYDSSTKALTFTISYNLAASFGALHIGVNATAPFILTFGAGTGVQSVPGPQEIIPGRALTEPFVATATSTYGRQGYYIFVEPYENNIKTACDVAEGKVSISIDSSSTNRTLKFNVTYDALAASGNISISISAVEE